MSPSESLAVSGFVAPGFEGVRDAFLENFASRGDIGAAVAVYSGGSLVVDLVGGVADPSTGRAYDDRTLQLVFSATKGATAICAHMLSQRGFVDLDAPIASYWSSFSQAGKSRVTTRMALSHRAGLPVIDENLTFDDLMDVTRVEAALERQAPLWEPGTKSGYHALTFGWIVGGVVRRVAGVSLGEFFQREVATPLGLRAWIGLPDSEQDRVAPVTDMAPLEPSARDALKMLKPSTLPFMLRVARTMKDPNSLANRATYMNGVLKAPEVVAGLNTIWNHPAIRTAGWPGASLVTDARSFAKMYAACIGEVDGVRLLNASTLADACKEQSVGADEVVLFPRRYGSGFELPFEMQPMLGPGSFGHGGMGGSLAFADVPAGTSFAYVTNAMRLDGGRGSALVDSLRSGV